jgi:hypothetical protein
MRLGSAFLSALFSLFLAGPPLCAQELTISRSPRELGTAVLRELSICDGKIRFRVDSGRCTDDGSFKVHVRKQEVPATKSTHYQLTIVRVRIDECKAMLWEGVVIELDPAKDLGLKGEYTVSVGNPVLSHLLAATVRAIELESEATERKLKAAEQGTGPQENVERFRQKLRDLGAERARFVAMESDGYPEPVEEAPEPASVLEQSAGFGPVLPPLLREVEVTVDGPLAEGALLPAQGASKSGPFYHLVGSAGGEYVGLIGDYFVYVPGAR